MQPFGVPFWSVRLVRLMPFLMRLQPPSKYLRLAFLEENCLECQDNELAEAGVDLSILHVDSSSSKTTKMWERVMTAVSDGVMPPAERARPDQEALKEFSSWLDQVLLDVGRYQETGLRPLTKSELDSTLEEVFRIPLDLSDIPFPRNRKAHFDRMAESSFVSAHLLSRYQAAGERVINALVLQNEASEAPVESRIWNIDTTEFNHSFSSITVKDDRVWLASAIEGVLRSSTWPTRFIAPADGVYKMTMQISSRSDHYPLVIDIHAQDPVNPEGHILNKRHLSTVTIENGKEIVVSVDIALQAGEVPLFYFSNSALKLEGGLFKEYLDDFFEEHPDFLSVFLSADLRDPNKWRGPDGYRKLVALSQTDEHRNASVDKEHPDYKKLIDWMNQTRALYAENLVNHHFEHGPAVGLSGVTVEGPTAPYWSPEDQRIEQNLKHFYAHLLKEGKSFGEWDLTLDRGILMPWVRAMLGRAFRSQPTEDEVNSYIDLIIATAKTPSATINDVTRSLVAKLLVSDRFIFHQHPNASEGEALAARLSFMLTSRPPSGALLQVADTLFSAAGVQAQADNLLKGAISQNFYKAFVSQWLRITEIRQIMPDQKFHFNDRLLKGVEEEPIKFFEVMVSENRLLEEFFNPDFVYTSPYVATEIYRLPGVLALDRHPANQIFPERISIPPGHSNRGLIGMAAPMMATSNGVDTELVHRGVWFLESILGRNLPGPPEAVPAITPDTNGAKTPADLLQKHTAHKGCVSCHQKIDPFGVVLESFNPIGRVRGAYETGALIEAQVETFDGKTLASVEDLRQWIIQNIDQFGFGLGVRMLEYGTGRKLNYKERNEVKTVVLRLQAAGDLRARTLLLELLATKTFRSL